MLLASGLHSSKSASDTGIVADRPDGSIFLVYRADPCKASAGGGAGGGESLGIATAKHWKGPYVRRAGGPIVSPANKTGDHEDPFLFTDPRGHYHIITHNQVITLDKRPYQDHFHLTMVMGPG